jgi:transcription-repair coupling factor (superfamily II helicase)
MNLTGLIDRLHEEPRFQDLFGGLLGAPATAASAQIIRAARPFLMAGLAASWPGPLLVIVANGKRAYNLTEQMPVWLGASRPILSFAEPTPMFYDRLPWDAQVIENRIEALAALAFPAADGDTGPPVIVTSLEALMQRTVPREAFRAATIDLRAGQEMPPARLMARCVGIGYEPVSLVTAPGMISRRGGILDVFPIGAEWPIRLEFFGDTIDGLRAFDPNTQRSVGRVEGARVIPAREALPATMPKVAARLADFFSQRGAREEENLSLVRDAEALANGVAFPHLEHYLSLANDAVASLLEYLPPGTLVITEDRDHLADVAQDLGAEAEAVRGSNAGMGLIPPDMPQPYLGWAQLEEDLARLTRLDLGSQPGDATQAERWFGPGPRYGGQVRRLVSDIGSRLGHAQTIVVVTHQPARLAELVRRETTIAPILADDLPQVPHAGALILVEGQLHEGWSMRGTPAIDLLTDAEIYDWSRPEPRRRQRKVRRAAASPDNSYLRWAIGDLVVHVDHGIGRFTGLSHRMLSGTDREYLVIAYADGDELLVPVHHADRLSRYVGAGDKTPALNRLGRVIDWTRARRKAREAAEAEARELLQIYAERASASGYRFSPDTAWQMELEASFPYVETEDQIRSLVEVKADMERDTPMDRLICGDVGFGKTEIALRAAFKAVNDGRQVAILVPTTVLAQQHYRTFSDRMAPFPVQVEMLSRFRTAQEQRVILGRLLAGEVDILIGTHRLLSGDIDLTQLGLIIIDEEQRFGVRHKEHFRKLRANVDVLTLTATPIPRTLYMSLAGVRDISMIQTPPEERLPIVTHVGRFDEKLLRHAILRELDRGGQVFIVHNRVNTIHQVQEQIERLVPDGRVIVAHGQMPAQALETVMHEFRQGNHDILLSTSIIESGLDIPTANTLIVDHAEWFGLAQLYQLRGRVGRSSLQAYAYFLHGKRITPEAYQRLEAMADYADLGSGFQIAMRDLELRGAGDILSTRQTGHISAVGLHLYAQLLAAAVRSLKGETGAGALPDPITEQERIILDLPVHAYLPTDWIPEMALRLDLYRRIGAFESLEDVAAMRAELTDRFGPLPPPVEGLLYQMTVKLGAARIAATAVLHSRDSIQIRLGYLPNMNRQHMALALGDDIRVTRTAVHVPFQRDAWQQALLDALVAIARYVSVVGAMPAGV